MIMRIIIMAVDLFLELCTVAIATVFALLGLGRWGLWFLIDMVLAWRSTRGGVLRCTNGHVVVSRGDDFVITCEQCGWFGEGTGALWRCGNVECRATTTFVNCPDCMLSVRSPYRWGR